MEQGMSKSEAIKQQILDLVLAYHEEAFAPEPFVPGETAVPVSINYGWQTIENHASLC